jgi:hypothetical protein
MRGLPRRSRRRAEVRKSQMWRKAREKAMRS